MWMTSYPVAMGWGFSGIFEKSSYLRFEAGRSRLIFWTWVRPVHLGLWDAPRVMGSDGTVSIVEIVSLSPCVEKPKSQEGNKSFVPEPRDSSVFRVFFGLSMHVNVLRIRKFSRSVHFTYSYHGYITIIWNDIWWNTI